MPIIHRITKDMMEFADVCDYLVNPCNLQGASGAGLSLEFRKRAPEFVDRYREACRTKELRIGTVVPLELTSQSWDMILLPTKDNWVNDSKPEEILRGLEALRELLKTDAYRYATIALPMLGCGLGKQDYTTVLPMMHDTLGDLEATVFISMAPDKTELRPRYLTVAGPLDYGDSDSDHRAIDWVITKTLEKWEMQLSDYDGIVSGGYTGVDAYVCGEHFGKAVEQTYIYQKTGKTPLVCRPNLHRNGVAAHIHLGNLLVEIAEDLILFKPKGHNNNRLSAMQARIDDDNHRRQSQDKPLKRVSVFGETQHVRTPENLLVPEEADIPY